MGLTKLMMPLTEIEWVKKNSTCLLDGAAVEQMYNTLAVEITEECGDKNPLILCVMTGAIVAVGSLIPKLDFALEVDYIHATRYHRDLVGGRLEWKQLPATPIQGRTVIIVDDVLDEGITMAHIKAYCEEQGAASCYTAVLVDKDLNKQKPLRADFVGYHSGKQYLFGLGMDYKGYLRNINGLYACPENIEELVCQS
ncbi:hypoxanthine-guanine phosphoribosyltransferase [Cycloclasticus pugetii]|uniref:hypoxanthine-guanine phosphoribosyltransferase n=1 Tax=Cycloclasticus pugetii TaxID=34068 RepID=UPI00035C27DE|nr:hypoxanthine-guanine phosphoribosyltransferase [Cycloclasticus pugetii]